MPSSLGLGGRFQNYVVGGCGKRLTSRTLSHNRTSDVIRRLVRRQSGASHVRVSRMITIDWKNVYGTDNAISFFIWKL
jgi:hypothetical protein